MKKEWNENPKRNVLAIFLGYCCKLAEAFGAVIVAFFDIPPAEKRMGR